jgi:hypothetical protein
MLSLPFKKFSKANISQTYHEKHKALDLVTSYGYGYGEPLCAPENCRIDRIVEDLEISEDLKKFEKGFGVWMTGLETGMVHLYWHTWGTIPVNGGDIVQRGQIVAFMGNSGNVTKGGVYVPVENRLTKPFLGTHLHYTLYNKGHKIGQYSGDELNPLDYFNWNWQPTYTQVEYLKTVAKLLVKMVKLINKK